VSEDACVARWCRCERIVVAGEGLSELGVGFVRTFAHTRAQRGAELEYERVCVDCRGDRGPCA
jgi:hypothetical protein